MLNPILLEDWLHLNCPFSLLKYMSPDMVYTTTEKERLKERWWTSGSLNVLYLAYNAVSNFVDVDFLRDRNEITIDGSSYSNPSSFSVIRAPTRSQRNAEPVKPQSEKSAIEEALEQLTQMEHRNTELNRMLDFYTEHWYAWCEADNTFVSYGGKCGATSTGMSGGMIRAFFFLGFVWSGSIPVLLWDIDIERILDSHPAFLPNQIM